MRKYDYVNAQHKIIIDTFLTEVIETANDCSPTNIRFAEFMYVIDMILDYHNEYGKTWGDGNFLDYLNIIPTNGLCAINGYLAGLVTKRNANKIAIYKKELSALGLKTVHELSKIKVTNE
tara:strand:- start:8751 stop:9110 length:360 start_codon:yes stop_codon:yes gene_type:complete